MSSELWTTRLLQFSVRPPDSGVVGDMHATESPARRPATRPSLPVVIGHRGAPAYRPEHTAAGFELAIDQGADLIEPDLVVTGDGVLVVRHENELSLSTDVGDRPEFASRRTTRDVGGEARTGWFTEDFTLAELRTLRAVERMPHLRPMNTAYDGHYGLLTFAEVVAIARRRSTAERPVRVLAELKNEAHPRIHGLTMADLVGAELLALGATDGQVVIQSFDADLLRDLRARFGDDGPRMVQLIHDFPEWDRRITRAGLREISTYAQGVNPSRHHILLRDDDAEITGVSDLVDQAHDAGLSVIPWTLRSENAYLPRALRRGDNPAGMGDAVAEARMLLALGVDGLITDNPDVAVRARDAATTAKIPAQRTVAA
jgi:glycerophosphoryl diester phosphodiesterase